MRLASIPVLLLPVVIFTWLLLATRSDHSFHDTLFTTNLLSGFVCLAWGFVLIYRRHRTLGFLCIGAALICLGALLWPSPRAKIHTDIISYETRVA
jgi:hypothetical protein